MCQKGACNEDVLANCSSQAEPDIPGAYPGDPNLVFMKLCRIDSQIHRNQGQNIALLFFSKSAEDRMKQHLVNSYSNITGIVLDFGAQLWGIKVRLNTGNTVFHKQTESQKLLWRCRCHLFVCTSNFAKWKSPSPQEVGLPRPIPVSASGASYHHTRAVLTCERP